MTKLKRKPWTTGVLLCSMFCWWWGLGQVLVFHSWKGKHIPGWVNTSLLQTQLFLHRLTSRFRFPEEIRSTHLKSKLHSPKLLTRTPVHWELAQPWVKLLCCNSFSYPLARTLIRRRRGVLAPSQLPALLYVSVVDKGSQTPDSSPDKICLFRKPLYPSF